MPSWVWILIFLLLLVVILVTVMWLTGAFAGINGPRVTPRDDTGGTETLSPGDREDRSSNREAIMPPRATPIRRSSRPPPALAGPVPDGTLIAANPGPAAGKQRSGKPPPASAASAGAAQPSERATPKRGVPPPAAAAWSKADGKNS